MPLLIVVGHSQVLEAPGTRRHCHEIAEAAWPGDQEMQDFVYRKQVAGMLAMQRDAVDAHCRTIAIRNYPNDYEMQWYVYSQQIAAKRAMAAIPDGEAKAQVMFDWPNDYTMQLYVYEQSAGDPRAVAAFSAARQLDINGRPAEGESRVVVEARDWDGNRVDHYAQGSFVESSVYVPAPSQTQNSVSRQDTLSRGARRAGSGQLDINGNPVR